MRVLLSSSLKAFIALSAKDYLRNACVDSLYPETGRFFSVPAQGAHDVMSSLAVLWIWLNVGIGSSIYLELRRYIILSEAKALTNCQLCYPAYFPMKQANLKQII